jgi:hypothetical protein
MAGNLASNLLIAVGDCHVATLLALTAGGEDAFDPLGIQIQLPLPENPATEVAATSTRNPPFGGF